MDNLEKVNAVIEKLEKGHINLYHDITKEELMSKVNAIDWNSLNKIEFDREMLKIFAMLKDAHTRYYTNMAPLKQDIKYIHGRAYTLYNGKYEEIDNISGVSVSDLVKRFEPLISYETKAWLDRSLSLFFSDYNKYEMIGLTDDLVCTLKNGKTIKLEAISEEELNNRIEENRKTKPYSYKILDDGILYLRYTKCQNDKDKPFDVIVEEIKQEYDKGVISSYILDLRGNSGGNSEILNPFQDFIRDSGLKGTMLIDNGVFSSGRFAVARFKRDFNTTIIGEETGGAAKSYGYNQNDKVEDLSFSYSIRLWDFSDIFGYTGSIKPDIEVVNTIEDIEANRDKQLEIAIEKTREMTKTSEILKG